MPATEPTEMWVFFDDDNLYIAARCLDSQPDRIAANELRRDNSNIFQFNDNFSVVLDTFHDQRNGFFFQTNPLGARARPGDHRRRNERQLEHRLGREDVARPRAATPWRWSIPFKSLRYRGGGPADLGHQRPAGGQVEERGLDT